MKTIPINLSSMLTFLIFNVIIECREKNVTVSSIDNLNIIDLWTQNKSFSSNETTTTTKPTTTSLKLKRLSKNNKTRRGKKKGGEEEAVPLWKVQHETIGKCRYCDPNFMKIPNFEDAMRGYDWPMGNPSPGSGSFDPGIRHQIFHPMRKNSDGFLDSDKGFISSNPFIHCDSTWSEEIFHNFDSYVKGKMEMAIISKGRGYEGEFSVPIEGTGLPLHLSFPPVFSRSSLHEDNCEDVKKFFKEERGSIAVSYATCTVYRVDISDFAKKVFLPTFIEGVAALEQVSDKGGADQKMEFQNFVNNFGTHFASTSHMGVRMVSERRYSAKERANYDDGELKYCNKVLGYRTIGYQSEPSIEFCQDPELRRAEFGSKTVRRSVLSTFGSFPAANQSEWMKAVIELHGTDLLRIETHKDE